MTRPASIPGPARPPAWQAVDPRLPSAVAAVDYTLAHDGGMWRIGSTRGELIIHQPREGFAVAVTKAITGSRDFASIGLGAPWTVADAADALLRAADAASVWQTRAESLGRTLYVGTWIEGCRILVDISTVVSTFEQAVVIGNANSQVAVYDFATGKAVWL